MSPLHIVTACDHSVSYLRFNVRCDSFLDLAYLARYSEDKDQVGRLGFPNPNDASFCNLANHGCAHMCMRYWAPGALGQASFLLA
jgi:hypothetical protein